MNDASPTIGGRLRKAAGQFPYLLRAFALVWAAAPRLTLGWLSLLLIQGVLPVGIVYLTRALVDSLVAAIGSGGAWESLGPTLLYVVLMALLMLLTELLRSLTNYVRLSHSELVKDRISDLIHHQSTSVDLTFYDSPDFFDRLHRARSEAGYRPVMLLESFGALLQNGLTLVAMAAVLLPYGVWLPLALFVSTLPALYVVLRNRILHHQWYRAATADERRGWYFSWLLTARDTAAEVGLFRLGAHFRAAHKAIRRRLRTQRLALARREGLSEAAAGLFGLVVTAGAVLWMVGRAVRGSVTLGDLALFVQAFNQGQRLLRSLLGHVGEIYSNMLFLGDLFEFLDMKPTVVDPDRPSEAPPSLKKGIRFRDVTFRYPGRSEPVIRGFNLDLPAGRIAAVVGANGSGKSTLLKLLCRLYDPEEGSVEIDGTDMRAFQLEDLRRLVTVIFQEPVHYNMTVAENITLGDLPTAPGRGVVEAAAVASGADTTIASLSAGYDTLLGTWFTGGAELSGGEWKRIALARTLVRKAPLILLDEPTSEMDPWASAEWVRRFRDHIAGRTAVVVTHRLATALCADIIHVMQAGEIIESGTHEELLAAGGRYGSLWQAQ